VGIRGPVTKIENIKTDWTKILRPTHFSRPKDIKTDRLFFGLVLCMKTPKCRVKKVSYNYFSMFSND
jgi:hypothetical protein